MPHGKIRQRLFDIFKKEWKQAEHRLNLLGLTKEEIEFYHDDSRLMLANFSDWFYKKNLPSPESSEAKIVSEKLRLIGIIDAFHVRGDNVILVDYKTCKRAKITDDIKRQAALYALLYQDKYKKVPDAVCIHFLKFSCDPEVIHVDDNLLDYAKSLIDTVRKKTTSRAEQSYPCTCGGYCDRDFIRG